MFFSKYITWFLLLILVLCADVLQKISAKVYVSTFMHLIRFSNQVCLSNTCAEVIASAQVNAFAVQLRCLLKLSCLIKRYEECAVEKVMHLSLTVAQPHDNERTLCTISPLILTLSLSILSVVSHSHYGNLSYRYRCQVEPSSWSLSSSSSSSLSVHDAIHFFCMVLYVSQYLAKDRRLFACPPFDLIPA